MKSQGGFLIAKIHQLGERIFSSRLKKFNIEEINPGQGRILFALWQNDNISIQELSQKTSLSQSTLTGMLDRLEKNGFIERVLSRDDRRKIFIKLTDKDKKYREIFEKVSEDMTDIFYKEFSKIEIEDFEKYLVRIFENLNNYKETFKKK